MADEKYTTKYINKNINFTIKINVNQLTNNMLQLVMSHQVVYNRLMSQ